MQADAFSRPDEIFSDYLYFSSFSDSWLGQCAKYADAIIERRGLGGGSFVVELASNDGYLLRNFVARGIPCLGVEPAANVAAMAKNAGIPTEVMFFGREVGGELAGKYGRADLVIANNVLAHVPNITDFLSGCRAILKPDGVMTAEFPHLLNLVEYGQFDTIYHEHLSYLSLHAVERVLERCGLALWDVEELPSHGGSVRVYLGHADSVAAQRTAAVGELLARERAAGLLLRSTYQRIGNQAKRVKYDLLALLVELARQGRKVAAYGAAAKGNTLLGYCGLNTDLIEFVVDRNPEKQGRFLPGSQIPVYPVSKVFDVRPDYILILPWNLRTEITESMAEVRRWGGRFITAIPKVEVL